MLEFLDENKQIKYFTYLCVDIYKQNIQKNELFFK